MTVTMESVQLKELSIIIPCLNEEQTISTVIMKSLKSIKRLGINGEVIIADNGSTDNSVLIAESLGARVIYCHKKGYGNALVCGFQSAYGKYLIMGDADDSYNFEEIDNFVNFLSKGFDVVMGSRINGKIEQGAMPLLNRYLGTPVLTFILNVFFGTHISDCNCGMRGLTKKAFESLKLESSGMEFASEMIIKAGILKLKIKEIPINFYCDKRNKAPHLRRWRDGWRHLKFMLLFAPNFVFMWPSVVLFFLGTALMMLQIRGSFIWGSIYLGIHSMIFGLTLSILGISIFQMGAIIKLYSHLNDYYSDDMIVKLLRKMTLEKQLIAGILSIGVGVLIDFVLVIKWAEHHFRDIFMPETAILGLYFIFLGISFVSFAFLQAVMRKET